MLCYVIYINKRDVIVNVFVYSIIQICLYGCAKYNKR